MLLAGLMLAEAAAIYDGKNAVQSQSYGPEARGGTSQAELIVSDEEIDYPKVQLPDILLAMTQEASDKFGGQVSKDGLILVDDEAVDRKPTCSRLYAVSVTSIARTATGTPLTASVVALGIIASLTGIVSEGALKSAVKGRSPRGTEKKNEAALAAGMEFGSQLAAL